MLTPSVRVGQMKRLRLSFVLLLCLLALCANECGSDVEVQGLPSRVYEGEVLPPLTFGTYEFGELHLNNGDKTGADSPLFGTTRRSAYDGGTVRFDDIIVPSTGIFAFTATLEGKNKDHGYSEPFAVTTRNFAEVTCQEDGSIIAAAAKQDIRPTIIGAPPFCKLTKGGSDPLPANFGTVRCDFLNVSASCSAPQGNCFNPGPRVRIEPGTSVSASWGGGEIPEGSATAVRPGALDAGLPPGMQSISAPMRLSFQGTPDGGGTVHVTVVQQLASTVAIDCWVPETAGSVEVPAALLSVMSPGDAGVILRIEGRSRVPSADFNTTLIVPGPTITGYVDAVPITLQP